MVFNTAGQAEILRASQKDEAMCKEIKDLVIKALQNVLSNRQFQKYREFIPIISTVLYYAVTTLSSNQTIGEEYTGLLMVDRSKIRVPSMLARLILVGMQSSVFYLILKRLKINTFIQELYIDANQKARINAIMDTVEYIFPILKRFHMVLFYKSGIFLDFAKRITGIHYVIHYYWLKDTSTTYFFETLYITSSIYLLLLSIRVFKNVRHRWNELRSKDNTNKYEAPVENTMCYTSNCVLCLENFKYLSAIPCGHIFCWNCILKWTQSVKRCPICKENTKPSQVILLQNF